MQADRLAPLLLLLAVGCARSAGTAGTAPPHAASAATPTASATTAAAPETSTQPAPAEGMAQRTPPAGGSGDAPQGIRVGEPAPDDPRGPHRPAPGTSWHAFGNEPFWSVEARGTTLVFTTPDDEKGVTLLGRRVPSLVGTVILGSGPRGDFHFGVTPGECSDGMSDRTYRHAATFIYGGMTYKGCAEPR